MTHTARIRVYLERFTLPSPQYYESGIIILGKGAKYKKKYEFFHTLVWAPPSSPPPRGSMKKYTLIYLSFWQPEDHFW